MHFSVTQWHLFAHHYPWEIKISWKESKVSLIASQSKTVIQIPEFQGQTTTNFCKYAPWEKMTDMPVPKEQQSVDHLSISSVFEKVQFIVSVTCTLIIINIKCVQKDWNATSSNKTDERTFWNNKVKM